MIAHAGEGEQIFMAVVFSLHAGETVVQVAAVQIPANPLLRIGPLETVLIEK